MSQVTQLNRSIPIFFLWELTLPSNCYYVQEINVVKISNSYNLWLDIISDC